MSTLRRIQDTDKSSRWRVRADELGKTLNSHPSSVLVEDDLVGYLPLFSTNTGKRRSAQNNRRPFVLSQKDVLETLTRLFREGIAHKTDSAQSREDGGVLNEHSERLQKIVSDPILIQRNRRQSRVILQGNQQPENALRRNAVPR